MLTRELSICFFGTYQPERVTRVAVLLEGLRRQGFPVSECRVAPGTDSAVRVKSLRSPLALLSFCKATAKAWWALRAKARRMPPPKAVLVPYMGHFDVHLARRVFPQAVLVLDHLIFASETASDRRANRLLTFLLHGIDALAIQAADLVVVDTEEHRQLVPKRWRHKAVVVPVGAPAAWIETSDAPAQPTSAPPLRIVFFGLYIPLQGVACIADALLRLKEKGIPFVATMIGTGQDYSAVRRQLDGLSEIRWIDWLGMDDLAKEVARHDVCLGIFGTSKKAARVVPQKLFLGAARGCAIVTSDTPPQRRCFGDAAIYATAGDPNSLATALAHLNDHREFMNELRTRSRHLAQKEFRPEGVTRELTDRLLQTAAKQP